MPCINIERETSNELFLCARCEQNGNFYQNISTSYVRVNLHTQTLAEQWNYSAHLFTLSRARALQLLFLSRFATDFCELSLCLFFTYTFIQLESLQVHSVQFEFTVCICDTRDKMDHEESDV